MFEKDKIVLEGKEDISCSKISNNVFYKLLLDINNFIMTLEKSILILLITEMVILATVQILSRFIIKKPVSWSEELLTYSFIWLSFIGASYALATKKHFEVDLFTNILNKKVKVFISFFMKILVLIFSIFFIVEGYNFASINEHQTMAVMPFTMFWPSIVMPISGLFMMVHTLVDLFNNNKGGK